MSASPEFDLLIVGSGPSGSHAAMEAVASGRKVALVEIGYSDDQPQKFDPSKTFSEIRRTDPNQQPIFLATTRSPCCATRGGPGPTDPRPAVHDPQHGPAFPAGIG